jgi:hypothetical protein
MEKKSKGIINMKQTIDPAFEFYKDDNFPQLENFCKKLTSKNVHGLYYCLLQESIKLNPISAWTDEWWQEWMYYAPKNTESKKGFAVYFLYKYDILVYIGKAKDVKQRFKQHRKHKDFDSWKIYYCESIQERDDIEELLIISNCPPYNKQIGGINYADMTGVYNEKIGRSFRQEALEGDWFHKYIVVNHDSIFVHRKYKKVIEKFFMSYRKTA